MLFAAFNFLSSEFIIAEQSFSIYMPYADTTMSRFVFVPQRSITISEHCACTALYNGSPVRLAIVLPPVRLVVDQIALMSPAMSRVPWVDKDFFFVLDKTALIPDNCFALSDLSTVFSWVSSPSVADSIALTSWAVLVMTLMFRSLKSCIWSDVCDSARSRDCISDNLPEHTHLRYASSAVAQN